MFESLPQCIGKEIFSYLLPKTTDIVFQKHAVDFQYDYYHPRYEEATINGKLCDFKGYSLSRIHKKNGKHRYYITCVLEDVIEVEYNDRPRNIYMYEYRSIYVGKNLERALVELFYDGTK